MIDEYDFIGECDSPGHNWSGWYNDEWNKKNERLWVSNRQELEILQPFGDGAVCSNPTQSEIRVRPTGSTSFQDTMWKYSTNLVHHLTPEGYSCYNEEQTGGYRCVDMEIRFCCPDQLCTGDCGEVCTIFDILSAILARPRYSLLGLIKPSFQSKHCKHVSFSNLAWLDFLT